MHDFLPNATPLSAAELDHRLEKAVQDHERAEKLICFYLYQINRRRHYHVFGFENIYDYAMERFSFCHSKTRTLLYLARKLTQLPRLTAALTTGKIGWTKAAKAASQASPETDEEWTGFYLQGDDSDARFSSQCQAALRGRARSSTRKGGPRP